MLEVSSCRRSAVQVTSDRYLRRRSPVRAPPKSPWDHEFCAHPLRLPDLARRLPHILSNARRPLPDNGKPVVRQGRKAAGQVKCLTAGLPKEGWKILGLGSPDMEVPHRLRTSGAHVSDRDRTRGAPHEEVCRHTGNQSLVRHDTNVAE